MLKNDQPNGGLSIDPKQAFFPSKADVHLGNMTQHRAVFVRNTSFFNGPGAVWTSVQNDGGATSFALQSTDEHRASDVTFYGVRDFAGGDTKRRSSVSINLNRDLFTGSTVDDDLADPRKCGEPG